MNHLLKTGILLLTSSGVLLFGTNTIKADTINTGDVVQIANNAWAESNGYNLVNHQNWQGTVTNVTKINHTSNSDYVYRIVYKNGEHNDYVLAQDVKLISLNNAKYTVNQDIKISSNAWAENNGYNLVNHQNWTGKIISRKTIIYNSQSQYEYYVQYPNGQHNDHVLEQDISNTSSKYNVGQNVQIASNAWAESNGYNLVNHQNWQGIITAKRIVGRASNSNYSYTVQYPNGEHNDYVLEQDLENIQATTPKYSVGQNVQIANNAWAESNGYNLVNHQNCQGTITARRQINKTSNSNYSYTVQYPNGQHNDYVLEQDLQSIAPKYNIGQTVQLNNNAWAESNGYNLVNHQNWVGTITARRQINSVSNSYYSYTVQYSNGEHNDYILEQDLHSYTQQNKNVSRNDIASQINNTTPNVDIAVYNVKTGQTTSYQKGSLDINYTASMVKVAILVELMHEQPNLTASQKSIASNMIINSDNDSATELSRQIGKDIGIQKLFNNLGMYNSMISGTNQWGLTSTNAADYMKLMKQVFIGGGYITDQNRQYIMQLMNSVNKNQRWGLPKTVSNSTMLYVKDGWLPLGNGTSNAIINSASYVKNNNSEYILIQMSNEDNTENDGFNMLNRVGQKVYDILN